MKLPDCDEYYLCLRAHGMGDLNAVDIAREVHEHVLKILGALLPEETLRYAEPAPAGDTWGGVYVDDLLTVFVYPADPSLPRPPPQPFNRDVVQAACRSGLRGRRWP